MIEDHIINSLIKPYSILPPEFSGILAGLVWGVKKGLSEQTYQMFQHTGLLHLMVLSGENITLLSGFISRLVKPLGYFYTLLTSLFVAIFYITLFHNEPSIVRASIMSLCTGLALLSKRTTIPLYIFLLTLSLMLLIQPQWAQSTSFWLSASATFGILMIYPRLTKQGNSALHDSFLLSFSAELCTLPIILFRFRTLTLLSLPMNIAVAWLIEPLMVLGLLLSIVGICIPILSSLVAFPLFGLLTVFMTLIKTGESISRFFILYI